MTQKHRFVLSYKNVCQPSFPRVFVSIVFPGHRSPPPSLATRQRPLKAKWNRRKGKLPFKKEKGLWVLSRLRHGSHWSGAWAGARWPGLGQREAGADGQLRLGDAGVGGPAAGHPEENRRGKVSYNRNSGWVVSEHSTTKWDFNSYKPALVS